ncbi:transcriptional repressor nf-x1 [Plakobranchus ocellatus]|uniref:Transcriptional repressor nf-x1 n=1 Tax=Plakobranchus ocellatus TaxID=259542 RepID=A0AAV3YKG6_9GAST|nr:transcriptional repressor nf-x1 [Plakobranchus ocellatus]
MSWQSPDPSRFPVDMTGGVLHPGMYVSDLEQHTYYGYQAPLEESQNIHSGLEFGDVNYYGYESATVGHDETYAPGFTAVYFSHTNCSPEPSIGSSLSSEAMAGVEAGATAFHHEGPPFPSSHNLRWGNTKGGVSRRGRRQNHFHQHFGRGGQGSYPQHEYYDDYGYPIQNYGFSDTYYRRDKREAFHRGSKKPRGRGGKDKSEYFKQESARALGTHRSDRKGDNSGQDLYFEEHHDNDRHEMALSNQALQSRFSSRGSSNVRGKRGKYPNGRGGSAPYQQSAASQRPTNSTAIEEREYNHYKHANKFPSRNDSEEKFSSSGPTNKVYSAGHFSASNAVLDRAKPLSKNGEPSHNSPLRQKGAKNSIKPVTKETDESQRATLTEQLSANKYECMVCCDNVRVEESIWSCQNCYHVFHLPCIKKWAQSSICQDTRIWRCPGCQNESTYIPSQYRCFCGRRRDPKYVRGETPHSCGESCRRKRAGDCRHPCTLLCHPGPCPPCSSMISVKCDCGKIRKNIRCSATSQFKCDQVCEKKLNCSEHKCVLQCHSGPCPPCAVSKSQGCFCKKEKRTVICGTNEYAMISFSCEKPCGRTLDCGNHLCEELCHPGECAPCILTPGNLRVCCCGKTEIKDLDNLQRQSCLDPVPTCGRVCHKPMACGLASDPHLCERNCHNGDCGPCSKQSTLRCECGATEKKMPCEVAVTFSETNPFKCQKRCGKKKTCGRHKCSDTCCVKDIHICEIVCGRKLTCGIHKCEELCHRGNCKRCLQASFDEVTCYCGAEVLEPPVPCGTRRPECHLPCTRRHECNHEVRHQCHAEEKCPPCTELTDKLCMGGHMMRKNVPCYLDVVSCGYPCHKRLPCGQHLCQKKCHSGECLEADVSCTQACPKPREACGHPCGAPCHTGDCPATACKMEITITCPCGNRSTKAQCLAGGDLQSTIAQFQRLSVQSMMESGGQAIDMAQFTQVKKSNKRLDCDTNCAIIERNKRLALALEIKNPDMEAKLGNPTFSEFLVEFAKKNPRFATTVEKNLSDLVQSVKQTGQTSKTHTFQPMNRDQRHFVHELAEAYGCQTQSYDYEPNKNVVATAARDKCWLPNITLVNHALKDQIPKKPSSRMGVSFTTMKKEIKAEVQEKPSSSRAWETSGWRSTTSTASTTPTGGASASASSASAARAKAAAPVIDYFDFDG